MDRVVKVVMPKKIKKKDASIGAILFWIAIAFTAVVYFSTVPRSEWFGRHEEIEYETCGDNIWQGGPNPYILNPNNQQVRNPNNWWGR